MLVRLRTVRLALALACPLLLPSVLLVGINPGSARADGDPASDVLLAQHVFYPYQPKVSHSLEAGLDKALGALTTATGVRLKVAIIGAAPELGLVPEFFGRPQAYAEFLDKEISNQVQPLLTVMPAGFGIVPSNRAGALTRVPVEARNASNGLVRSAILAVVAIARYDGHPIAVPSLAASSSGGSSSGVLVFAAPTLLIVLAGVIALVWRRSRSR